MAERVFRVVGATADHSNLTELNATESVNGGFINHSDWLAHVMRYTVVMNYMLKGEYSSVLDVGCGNFPLLTYLWRNRVNLKGLQYTGIDLRARKQWLDQRLPEHCNIDLVKMNIVKDDAAAIIPHQIVVCTEMLEHIDKKEAYELMRRLFNWTVPGGLMFLSSPNLGGSDTVAENHTAPDGSPREWTYEGKVKLVKLFGFEIIDEIGTFIRLDHIPDDFWTPQLQLIKKRLPNSFFRVFAAAAFPAFSNNAMLVCRRP